MVAGYYLSANFKKVMGDFSKAAALFTIAYLSTAGAAYAEQGRAPQQVYNDVCSFCHGHVVAPGITVAPNLLGRELPQDMVKTYVRTGQGKMPAFRHTEITDAELDNLAKWLEQSPTPAQEKHP